MTTLHVEGLCVDYGGVPAVSGVGFDVPTAGLVALVGPNGAGKSTIARACLGMEPTVGGDIVFDGSRIVRQPTHVRIRAGLAFVPEGRCVVPSLTVRENLGLSVFSRRFRRRELRARVEDVLGDLAPLRSLGSRVAGTLSGGEQQLLAIGRALMGHPTTIILDEPTMGLAPRAVAGIGELLRHINDRGVAIVLIEQNAEFALALANDTYVLDRGTVVAAGPTATIGSDVVMSSYFGR